MPICTPSRVLVAALACLGFATAANAGLVQVNFSGGNGQILTATLPQPVTFTVTHDTPNKGSIFVFRDVGNITNGAGYIGSGTLAYSVNGGAASPTLNSVLTGNIGAADDNDLSIFVTGDPVNLSLNDSVVLSSGFISRALVYNDPPPPSGLYDAILIDGIGNQLGSAVAVPEPASVAVLGLAGVLLRGRGARRAGRQKGLCRGGDADETQR